MNFLEALTKIIDLIGALSKIGGLLRLRGSLLRQVFQTIAYENLSLDYVFDLRDSRGDRAVIKRTQRVKFCRADDDGIIRDLIWGEGEPLKRYSVAGARCLGVRDEGSKRVALLALAQKPRRGDIATVTTSRLARNPVRGASGYAESSVERPTKRLGLKVLFPRTRPPRQAHLIVSPPGKGSKPMRVRYGPDGRPFLTCRFLQPRLFTTYSLRWLW